MTFDDILVVLVSYCCLLLPTVNFCLHSLFPNLTENDLIFIVLMTLFKDPY